MEWIQLKEELTSSFEPRTPMEGFLVQVFTGRGEKQGDRAQSFFMSHFIFWF